MSISKIIRAPVQEIFASVQGEGLLVGIPMIFVRLNECNLKCNYCDTPTLHSAKQYTAEQTLNTVRKLATKTKSKWISITGGEPLLHPGFVLATASKLKQEKYSLYLEANGTLPDELSKIEHCFDYFSIDIKLPADCGGKEWWRESAECLRIAGKRAFSKIVITPSTPFIEIQKAIETAVSVLPKITIILQPASSPDMPAAVSSSRLKKILKYALNIHTNVRMIPQMHRILGWK